MSVSLQSSSGLLHEEKEYKNLLSQKYAADRELARRRTANPLRYYWPHSGECKGPHEDHTVKGYNHRKLTLPDGTTYEIEGCPQYAFHMSLKPTRALFGGNRSGKTCGGLVETAFHLTGTYPDWYPMERRYTRPVKGRFCASDYAHGVGEVIIPAIEEWIPRDRIKSVSKNNQGIPVKYWIKHPKGTSVVDILTYEQDPKVYEGWWGDFVWYDEPPPRPHRVANLRGLTDRLGWEVFTLTPLDQPWLFDEIWNSDSDNVGTFLMDIRHNLMRTNPLTGKYIGISEEGIERFEEVLTDEEKQVRRHGKFTHLAGRIWKTWDRNIHTFNRMTKWVAADRDDVHYDGEPPKKWQRIHLVDPHDRKPTAMLWAAKDPNYDIVYVWREALLKNSDTFKDDCMHVMKQEMDHRDHVIYRIMDPNFGPKNQKNTGETVRESFEKESRDLGFEMRFSYADDHKELGRKEVQKMLHYDKDMPISIINRPQLMIADDLVHCIYMIEHYIWDNYRLGQAEKDPKEKVKDINTDFPDLLQYLSLFKWRDEPAEVFQGPGNMYT